MAIDNAERAITATRRVLGTLRLRPAMQVAFHLKGETFGFHAAVGFASDTRVKQVLKVIG